MEGEEFHEDLARWLEQARKHRFESALYEFSLRHLTLPPPLFAPPETPILEEVEKMAEARQGYLLVGTPRALLGIFTERDLLSRVLPRKLPLETTPLAEVMTRNPRCLKRHARLVHALNLMVEGGFRHIPVVEDGIVVGVLSVREMMGFLADLFPDEILNIPPEDQDLLQGGEG